MALIIAASAAGMGCDVPEIPQSADQSPATAAGSSESADQSPAPGKSTLLVPAPVRHRRPPVLRWNVRVGEKLRYLHTTERTSRFAADAPESTTTRRTYVTLEAQRNLPDRSIRFLETINRISVKKTQPPQDFDSDRDPIPPQVAFFVGRTFTFAMDPHGRVSDVALDRNFPLLPPQLRNTLGPLNTPSAFENLIPKFTFPEDEVVEGTQWVTAQSLEGSAVGDTKSEVTNRFIGFEEAGERTIAKVALSAVFTQSGEASSEVPFKIIQYTGGGEGLARFDATAGRLVESHLDEKNEMDVEANGRQMHIVTQGFQKWELLE